MWKMCRLAACVVTAVALSLTGSLVARADSTSTVYNTPGGQSANGRLWNTECEKYSSNVVRCRTDIWATQVFLERGQYVKKTGWTFNNLSYLASPRGSWKGNNLGQRNARWVSGGKTWKTECDTATTGKGGCRSYVWTKQVQAKKSGSSWTYVNAEGWVFNNLVLFAEGGVKPVTRIPAHVVDQSRLDFTGIGPIRVDTNFLDLERLGYTRWIPGDCAYWEPSQLLQNRGIEVTSATRDWDVWEVVVHKPGIRTVKGASVGMTVGQVKGLYGSHFAVVPKENHGVTQYFGTVRSGAFELQFRVDGPGDSYAPTRPLRDSDVIREITAQRYIDDVSSGGC